MSRTNTCTNLEFSLNVRNHVFFSVEFESKIFYCKFTHMTKRLFLIKETNQKLYTSLIYIETILSKTRASARNESQFGTSDTLIPVKFESTSTKIPLQISKDLKTAAQTVIKYNGLCKSTVSIFCTGTSRIFFLCIIVRFYKF